MGLTYSQTSGNYNLPGVYVERLFLGFRGFWGDRIAALAWLSDPSSLAGMRLGPISGQTAGQGNCHYYNPFGNAIEYSDQPGSAFENSANPDYRSGLENSPELREWLANQEVDMESTADMLVAEATLTGAMD